MVESELSSSSKQALRFRGYEDGFVVQMASALYPKLVFHHDDYDEESDLCCADEEIAVRVPARNEVLNVAWEGRVCRRGDPVEVDVRLAAVDSVVL